MQPDGCDPAYDRRDGCATEELRVNDPIVRSVELAASPAEVWRALTQAEELRGWFGADLELDARPGGSVRARWPDGARSVGSVEVADEGRRLVFRWRRIDGAGFAARVGGASRVEFVLRPAPGGTSVSVREEPVELASVVDAG
jgi:uncharacterized protein YndB with AHSA1/START domain